MPSIDPIVRKPKKTAAQGAVRPRLPARQTRQAHVRQASGLTPDAQHRLRVFRLTIALVMIVIVGLWVVFFQHITSSGSNRNAVDPFTKLIDTVSSLFGAQKEKDANANVNNAEQERLRELRSYVFPQFTNTP